MKIECIRVYAEVLEQGIDFKEYLKKCGIDCVTNIYAKKNRKAIASSDSVVDRIRKCKDVDVFITAISEGNEYPLLMIEYSTAVPSDDHKMQRSDVYYWSSLLNIPMMKIYPNTKNVSQRSGAGHKFTDEAEIALVDSQNGIFYPINWETIKGTEVLKTKDNSLSCISFSSEILEILKTIIDSFNQAYDYNQFYSKLRDEYHIQNKKAIAKYNSEILKSLFSNSTRFKWDGDRLVTKINRFGHAMDPERGVLYFTNMLLGTENCIAEIQINRPKDYNARKGYKSLFDGLGKSKEAEMKEYIQDIILHKNNVFTADDAIHVFESAMEIANYDLFTKTKDTNYEICDSKLKEFLLKNPNVTSKSIFFLTTKLILTDTERKEICSISWNSAPIMDYLKRFKCSNYKPIAIKPLTLSLAKEDIITYSSVELYKRMNSKLVAVSYPGAQGDRCILHNGKGRKVKRIYIDIIAINESGSEVFVLLEECKEKLSSSEKDIAKLNDILDDSSKVKKLESLIGDTIGTRSLSNIKISVGAKAKKISSPMKVDYIFMFTLTSENGKTKISYQIAIIDTSLMGLFSPLLDENRKLQGDIYIDEIYTISN